MNIKLFHNDCLIQLKHMKDNSIDMICTSPPYDNLRKYNGYSFDFEAIAKELARVLKVGGVMIWVVNDSTKNNSETLTSFRQAIYFHDVCKLNIYDTMIFKKQNPLPLNHKRYEPTFEYMFCISKGKPTTFNGIHVPCKYAGTAYWGNPSVYKTDDGKLTKTKIQNIKNTKLHSNIFEYLIGSFGDNKKYKHPAMFPVDLAKDQIATWSNEGETILDPFAGASTTGVAAVLLHRNYIGIDSSMDYITMSQNRLQEVLNDSKIMDYEIKRL